MLPLDRSAPAGQFLPRVTYSLPVMIFPRMLDMPRPLAVTGMPSPIHVAPFFRMEFPPLPLGVPRAFAMMSAPIAFRTILPWWMRSPPRRLSASDRRCRLCLTVEFYFNGRRVGKTAERAEQNKTDNPCNCSTHLYPRFHPGAPCEVVSRGKFSILPDCHFIPIRPARSIGPASRPLLKGRW